MARLNHAKLNAREALRKSRALEWETQWEQTRRIRAEQKHQRERKQVSERKPEREWSADHPRSERPWDKDGLIELRQVALTNLHWAETLAPVLAVGALL